MESLFHRIASQGARARRVALLAFLAGGLLYMGHPGHIGPLPLPLVTGFLYALLITPAAVLTAAILPALTGFSDAVQWARLGLASAVAALPALRPVAEAPLLNATCVILIASALAWAQTRAYRGAMSPSALVAWKSATKA